MRILYVSQYFPPEMGAPSARVSELARHWVDQGHDVTVLTGFPNHPTGVVPPAYRSKLRRLTMREQHQGVDVIRTWLLPTPNGTARQRMANYVSFAASAALRGVFMRRPDVTIATSPQLLVGTAGWWISRTHRTPFVFEVRDLWPESLAAVGMGSERSPVARGLDAVARFLYKAADHVVTVAPAQRKKLIDGRGLAPDKIDVVENGVETDLFKPMDVRQCREALGLPQDRFIAAYVGTLGLAHGLGTILEAAQELQDRLPNALLILVGEGADKAALERQAKDMGLTNLRFFPGQPRALVPTFIGASDACIVTLREAEVFRTVIPSKMLEFMACARPVVLAVDGQARSILEAAQGGIAVAPENPQGLVWALSALEGSPGMRATLGENGRQHILSHYQRESQARRYLDLLSAVAGVPAAAPVRIGKRSITQAEVAGSPAEVTGSQTGVASADKAA